MAQYYNGFLFASSTNLDGENQLNMCSAVGDNVRVVLKTVTTSKGRLNFLKLFAYDGIVYVQFRKDQTYDVCTLQAWTLDLDLLYSVDIQTLTGDLYFNGDVFVSEFMRTFTVHETKTGAIRYVFKFPPLKERLLMYNMFMYQNTFMIRVYTKTLGHAFLAHNLITKSWLPTIQLNIYQEELEKIVVVFKGGYMYALYAPTKHAQAQVEICIKQVNISNKSQRTKMIRGLNINHAPASYKVHNAVVYKDYLIMIVDIEYSPHLVPVKLAGLMTDEGITEVNFIPCPLLRNEFLEAMDIHAWKNNVFIYKRGKIIRLDLLRNVVDVQYIFVTREVCFFRDVVYVPFATQRLNVPDPETPAAERAAKECTFDDAYTIFKETFDGNFESNPYFQKLIEKLNGNWGYYGRMLELLQFALTKPDFDRIRGMMKKIVDRFSSDLMFNSMEAYLYDPDSVPANPVVRGMREHREPVGTGSPKRHQVTAPRLKSFVGAEGPLRTITDFLGT